MTALRFPAWMVPLPASSRCRKHGLFMVLAGASLAVWASAVSAGATPPHVLDGDSLRLAGGDIRLWGLDAPEWDQAGGASATDHLHGLVASGGQITCEAMYLDRHGRTVARCVTEDGRDLACEQIRAGVAREHRRYSHGAYRRCAKPR